jgi:hypothetical protein
VHVTRSGRDRRPCRQRGSQQGGCPQHPPVHTQASRGAHDSSSGRRTDNNTADGTSVTSIRRTEQDLPACSMPASAVPPSTAGRPPDALCPGAVPGSGMAPDRVTRRPVRKDFSLHPASGCPPTGTGDWPRRVSLGNASYR